MAPSSQYKRVKGVQIFRPFVYGTTATIFNEKNPRPADVPEEHTHRWTVFVKGVDDTDITYWCKKVHFKLHESIPTPLRQVEDVRPGDPFQTSCTGWGEFEINIKIFYEPLSQEKAQIIYHHLNLHPYGATEAEKDVMRASGIVKSWQYEEQVFNEPYEPFYDILTSPVPRGKGSGAKAANAGQTRVMGGGMVSSVGERTALIPLANRPNQPFSRDTEKTEIRKLEAAMKKVEEQQKEQQRALREGEQTLRRLKAEANV